jgi:hypothetical protein
LPLLAKTRSFLRNLVSARRADVDLDQEVRSHLDLLTVPAHRATCVDPNIALRCE